MASRFSVAAFCTLCALLLDGCAWAPMQAPTMQQAAATRTWHEAIDIAGRISVRYQQQGEQLLTGSFNWSQRPGRTSVTLLTPFGQTLARIEVEPGRAVFQRSGEAPRVAANVDALAAQALGWPLPVSGLQAWLQGFASAGGKPVPVKAEAPAALVSADGWRIAYASWVDDDNAQPRPRRIDLSRRTEQAGDVEMRIVIDNWQPHRSTQPAAATGQ